MSSTDIKRMIRGAMLPLILLGVAGAAVAAFLTWYFYCPCDRTPGGYLFGDLNEEPIQDWSFANDVPLCQIQVDTGILSQALNLNCMATADGRLYLSCAQCEGKRWSAAAIRNPEARLRLGETLYPVTLTRVLDPAEADRSYIARALKTQGREAAQTALPRSADWWTFRVESLGGS